MAEGARGALPPRRPTITDVAAQSGVTPSTVSRAFKRPDQVNRATRERIEIAAKQLGYAPADRPGENATVRRGSVAVLVPDITNPFFFDFIRSTQHQLRAFGYAQILVDTEEDLNLEAQYLDEFHGAVAGFILAATRLEDTQLIAAAEHTPLVTFNRDIPGIPSVVIGSPDGARQALEHLYSLGHRDIAYIAGPAASWSDAHRWAMLEHTADTLGATISRLGPYHPSQGSGAAAAEALLNSGASACIAFNDVLAIGILVRLHERGIDVPGELSVVGCDDIFGADFCSPPLTTIVSPIEQAGRVATDLLIGRLRPDHAPPRSQVVLPAHLKIRSSTGPLPPRTA